MKKLILIAALLIPVVAAQADPGDHRHEREHREWHDRGGHFGWGEFVGLGGIIAHKVNDHYYDNDEEEVRRISVCNDFLVVDRDGRYVYDQWGHMVVERRCHDEWVRVDR